jgi:uncharacterized protein YecE (DUF72 family)
MPDETPDLFAPSPAPAPSSTAWSKLDLPRYREQLATLARHGLFIGTSSWKYPGWCGLVYEEERYLTRKKFSEAKFNRECLGQYGETYSSVCVDAGYYQFPTADYIGGMCAQVPDGFKFGIKVTDDITIRKFPSLPRLGARAGTMNPNFLNAEMFTRLFLGACQPHQTKIGPLIFEFSSFKKEEFEHGRDFLAALDQFLGRLPKGWQYGVEIRNKGWLAPEYFDMLRTHNVAHVYNNWTRMPSVGEQMALPGSQTADFSVARFLLKPGRTYEQAVNAFTPYKEIKERVAEAVGSVAKLLESSYELKRMIYIYINNRLEGSAPLTIDEIMRVLHIFIGMLMKKNEGGGAPRLV